MSSESRTVKSARNMAVGLTTQFVLVLLSFAARSVFVSRLGLEIVGVNALLLSIFAILAVTDLGLNSAVMFALYKPLGEGDTAKIGALVRFCASFYRYVALALVLIGLAFLPFLGRLVNGDLDTPTLSRYYLILLINSAASYLMAHRSVLLQADQRAYVVSLYAFAFKATATVAQITALLVLQSYLLFLIIQVVFTLLNNLAIFRHVGKHYPYLRRDRVRLDLVERRLIFSSVRALFIYRVGGAILINSDPILISMIVGTVALGRYSNYLLIIGAMLLFTELVFASLAASVGDRVVSSDERERRHIFDELMLLAWWVFGCLSTVLLVISSDFIRLWIGNQYVLGPLLVAALVLNFYMAGISVPVWTFRNSTGMFRQTRYVLLLTAALNIGLSVALGREFGVVGILLATTVSRLLTSYWYEPWILHRRYLGASSRKYFITQVFVMALFAGTYLGVEYATARLPVTWWSLGVKTVTALMAANAAFLFVAWRVPEFRTLWRRLRLVSSVWSGGISFRRGGRTVP